MRRCKARKSPNDPPMRCNVRLCSRVGSRAGLVRYAQSDLDKVALRLNQRPRKTLDFETPASKLQAALHRPVEAALLELFGEADLAIYMPHQIYPLKRSPPSLSNATSQY
jgi:hypothetical protein